MEDQINTICKLLMIYFFANLIMLFALKSSLENKLDRIKDRLNHIDLTLEKIKCDIMSIKYK